MAAPAQYSSSDEELAESFQPARTPRVQEDKSNPDLFYRLKLKLWNRDRMTDCIRCAYVEENDPAEDRAHWALGTRVVISDDNDHYTGKIGRIVEYRGKGIYAIVTEDGHKVCYSPLQFHRCADQKGPKKGTGNHVTLDLQTAIMASGPALKVEVSPRPEPKEAQPPPPQPVPSPLPQMPPSGGRVSVGGGGGGAGKDSHLPTGTRVRIVRAYGGGALAKEDVKTGTTTTFTHGWYYIQLDDNAKQTSCRRHSFVVIGDEEDVGLGYVAEGGGGASAGTGGGEGVGEAKGGGDGGGEDDKGRKRGRASKGGAEEEEDEDEDEDEDDDEGGKRKKGKKEHGKKGKAKDDDERDKDEEERKRREREEEKKRKEKERKEREEAERQREDDDRRRAEAEMSQEDRDALEAARLAAMLNRNPRRRGGPDPAPPVHIPAVTKPAPAKHKGANKPSKGAQEGSGKKANSGSAKDVPGKPGKKGKEDGEKGGSSISAQDIFGDEDEE